MSDQTVVWVCCPVARHGQCVTKRQEKGERKCGYHRFANASDLCTHRADGHVRAHTHTRNTASLNALRLKSLSAFDSALILNFCTNLKQRESFPVFLVAAEINSFEIYGKRKANIGNTSQSDTVQSSSLSIATSVKTFPFLNST